MFPFTLHQLQILQALAKEKNFTKAADLVYISQPSLSKQIKILEKNLNQSLVYRQNNQIFLTENGQTFLNYSRRILALSEESCRVLMDLQNQKRTTLRIGINKTLGKYLLPKIIQLFLEKYELINLKIVINSTNKIIRSIENREIEIGLIHRKISNPRKKNFLMEPFADDKIHLIRFHSNLFSTDKMIISKEELYHCNLIVLKSNFKFQKFMNHHLQKNQIQVNQLKVALELNSIEALKVAVILGLGVAFISSLVIEKESKLKTIQILKIKNVNISQPLVTIKNLHLQKLEAINFNFK